MKKNLPLLLPLLFAYVPSYALELKLEDYLEKVKANNHAIKASLITLASLESRRDESTLLYKPQMFSEFQFAIDQKPTTNIAAQGNQTNFQTINAGLMQQFEMGLKAKLKYSLSHTHILNASPSVLPLSNYNDAQLSLELSQSLLRNSMGSETKAQKNLADYDRQSKVYLEQFKVKTILTRAEALYYSFAQLKKMHQVQKETLERALKLKSWTENRVNSGLGDRSDLLQADSNVRFREYEMAGIEQQLASSKKALFNMMGEVDQSSLQELNLSTAFFSQAKDLNLASFDQKRLDLKAQEELIKLAKENIQLSIERNKPNLEVYGSYALNGRDSARMESITNGFKTDHDTIAMGLRFSAPLDLTLLSKNRESYNNEKAALELNLKQKEFDIEEEWKELTRKFKEAKTNLLLSTKIEEAQKTKAINERDRLSRGRTTTFQVLNFDQDLAQSSLLKMKHELELLNYYAQSKLFTQGGEQ